MRKSIVCFLMMWGLMAMSPPVDAADEKSKPAGGGKEDVIPVKAIRVAPVSKTFVRRLPATLMTEVETRLAFRVSGRISSLPVEVGQVVKKGELIGLLDPRDFEDAAGETEAALDQAQARQKDAGLHLKRMQKLWANQDVDISQLDRSRADARSADDQVKMQKRQSNEARRRLSYTRLEAPFTGVIAQKKANLFVTVAAGQMVVLFVDLSRLNGLRLQATLEGIGPSALPPANTYPITVIIQTGPKTDLRPGMNGLLEITVKRATDDRYIQIPLSALATDPKGKTRVWVVDEKKGVVQPRQVVTGGLTKKGIEIKSGLSAGEWVVTAGLRQLRPGKRVMILKK
ncbi:MAG: efflux RND transporter periplasmic adaptor subunit [Deltaproteobacteria bacterium]|nr:efflux RND transporter periplasmic adaptor subunit [Deltaproteobacteria bacterium]